MCLSHEVCAPSFGIDLLNIILSFLFLLYFYLLFFHSFSTSPTLISDLLRSLVSLIKRTSSVSSSPLTAAQLTIRKCKPTHLTRKW